MCKAISLFLIGLLSIRLTWGVTYITNRCLCQLDQHLNTVRHNLRIENSTYPPTPKQEPTTPMPQSGNTGGSGSGANTTDAGNTTTTQQANSTDTTPPPTTAAAQSGRRKREANTNSASTSSSNSNEASSDKGVLLPVYENIVSYDQTIRLSGTDGVSYDKNYAATSCNCTIKATVKLSICFLNIKYTSDFANPKSDIYKAHINRLLPWMDGIFENSAIKSVYMRTVPLGFTAFREDPLLQAHFIITLNTGVASPVYEIDSGFQTKEVMNGRLVINGFVYETDVENEKDCYTIEDTTPAPPKEKPSLGTMRYAFLGAGCALALLILLFICCGRNDKFYVRFW